MALQLDYVLNISSEPKNVYVKIEQANTIVKKEIIDEDTGELAETLKTYMRVSFYNSQTDRIAEKNPIERKSFIFENQAISSLASSYTLLKTHADFTEAIDV